MKLFSLCSLTFAMALVSVNAEPLLTSWFTERSGAYARIFETTADETSLNAVTTWSNGAGVQAQPTYAGVHEIAYTDDWVYIRTTNLASYTMGPWYLNEAKTNLFPNYPSNQATLYRLPRNPTDPTTVTAKTLTGGGPIGYFVNGVAMFDSRDAFSYDVSTGTDINGQGADGAWNRDAYVNESVTFDVSNAHQAGGRYHYHANPPALRYQLGDSVTFTEANNTYTEQFNGQHSPILAWTRDGLPVYGPYAYSDPTNANSAVTRMRSGYQLRTDIAAEGSPRSTWPAWATRVYAGLVTFAAGPAVSNAFPLGRYLEDNDYKGDLGMTLGTDFDLNEYNVRYCVTPEFPEGTWAYFVSIAADGTPTFPYNIGRSFWGEPVGGDADGIPDNSESTATVTTLFEGGPELPLEVESIAADNTTLDTVTLLWNGVEGATYEIVHSTDLGTADDWEALAPQIIADSDRLTATHDLGAPLSDSSFYQINRVNLAPFDDNGFDYTPTTNAVGTPVTLNITMSGGPEDLTTLPISLTFGGIPVDISTANISRASRQELTFDFVIYGMAPGDYSVVAEYAQGPIRTGTHTIHSNVLLMIIDDWGLDASPLDNTTAGANLANMPTLSTLASEGLRFTRAYSQPTCSPMRATMLTGRQPFQHNVGTPENASNFSSSEDEVTLPEIFTLAAAPHALISVGKWHLGGNETGYSVRGGWPEFYGINGGGVGNYSSWEKNSNGSLETTDTYTTTDQVNEASQFINQKVSTGTPWFAWVAFNAPHTPFHEPPAELAPEGGYSTIANGESSNSHYYRMMLEALDTEMARLLASIDPAQTNIILIGDNGTPGQTVQAPFGNGNSKGDLYNGGIHVPMIVTGPAVEVTPGSTTETLVHCVDVFSTVLELAGIDESAITELATRNVSSTSIVPILAGTDTADRYVIAERKGGSTNPGRAIIVDDYPDYKLIINGDPDSTIDDPTFEFYNIGAPANDVNEQAPLEISALTGTALEAYNACIAKDLVIGGGYSDLASNYDTLYIELPTTGVTPEVPELTRNNNNEIAVQSATVDGNEAHIIGRFSPSSDLTDESDDTADRHWVKVRISPANGGPYSTARVIFPEDGTTPREYDSINSILVNPNL